MVVLRGLSSVLRAMEGDFEESLPDNQEFRREGLVTLAAAMVEARRADLMYLATDLPRKIGPTDHCHQYVSRFPGNTKNNRDEVMAIYAKEIFARLAARRQTIVVMLDQSAFRLSTVSAALRRISRPLADIALTEGKFPAYTHHGTRSRALMSLICFMFWLRGQDLVKDVRNPS